jgi:thiol-disulfide isomerase/thioredoxin
MSSTSTSCFFAVLSAAALLACGCGQTQTARADSTTHKQRVAQEIIRFVKNPDPAPTFQLDDLQGKPLSLNEAKGKVVILNFWATWCGPCRAEIPDLVDLQKRYADKLEIIALVVEEDDANQVKRFVAKSGINYRVAMAPDEVAHNFGGIVALPTSFIIDPQGRIVQKHIGLNDPTLYERELRAMLGELPDATIQYFEDNGQIFLKNAERATELPDVDFSPLTPEQKAVALRRMNASSCNCGCRLTLAQCRINDTGCQVSRALAARVVAEAGGKVAKAPASPRAATNPQ